MPKGTTWTDISWYLVSYENQGSSLVGSLRLQRLQHFLQEKGLTSEFITRTAEAEDKVKIIDESPIIRKWRIFFNVLFLPDASFIWSISVFNYLKKKETPFIVITSLPPYGLCWVGLLLKRTTEKAFWVLDFRDPWTLNPLYKPFFSFLKMPFIRLLEAHALQKADLILLNTDTDLEAYTKKYPFIQNKSITVRNGFDQLLENKSGDLPNDVITLVYAGGAYTKGEAPLAISGFLRKINEIADQVFCDYYGEHHPALDQSKYIQYKGTFPQKEIPGILTQYKMGLIYLPEANINSGRIVQKFYDYIGSGVQPIVINPSCEMEKQMDYLGMGLVVFPSFDAKTIFQKIKNIYTTNRPVEKEKLPPFTRAYQFEKLLNFTLEKYKAYEK
jgi:hypothetical protein